MWNTSDLVSSRCSPLLCFLFLRLFFSLSLYSLPFLRSFLGFFVFLRFFPSFILSPSIDYRTSSDLLQCITNRNKASEIICRFLSFSSYKTFLYFTPSCICFITMLHFTYVQFFSCTLRYFLVFIMYYTLYLNATSVYFTFPYYSHV